MGDGGGWVGVVFGVGGEVVLAHRSAVLGFFFVFFCVLSPIPPISLLSLSTPHRLISLAP